MNRPANVGCSVAGCRKPHRARGLCTTHYIRVTRTGTVNPPAGGIAQKPGVPADQSEPMRALRDGGTLTLQQYLQIRAAS